MASNKPPNVVIEALRGSRMPQGYLLGRSSMGTGAVELLTLAQAKSVGLASVTLPPSGPAGGDLSGTYPNPTVVGLQGRAVSASLPGSLNVLAWNNAGSTWAPLLLGAAAYSDSYLDLINLPPLTGGTAGQVLTKISGTAYDFGWAAPAGGSVPGSAMDDGTNLYLAMIDGAGQLILDAFGDPIWAAEVLPDAAMPADVADFVAGTWIPTDASGAGLTFGGSTVGNFIHFTKAKLCYIFGFLTVPANASGAQMQVGGLPRTVSSLGVNGFPLPVDATGPGTPCFWFFNQATTTAGLGNFATGAAVTNTAAVGNIYFACMYPTT